MCILNTSLFQKLISQMYKAAAFVKIKSENSSKTWVDSFSVIARGGSTFEQEKVLWQTDEVKLNRWIAIVLVAYRRGSGVQVIQFVDISPGGGNVTGTVVWVKLKYMALPQVIKPFRNCVLVRHNSTHPYSSVSIDGVDEWYNGTWPMSDQQRKKNFDLEGKLYSWNEAFIMCQRMGIHLLYHIHKEDLAYLMHYIGAEHRMKEKSQFEGLFVNQHKQIVSKILFAETISGLSKVPNR